MAHVSHSSSPRENAKITFVLSGINAPKSARNANEASEPFGQEAHDLANRRLTQRDVEIDVEDNDKQGGFIGKIYVNKENYAAALLESGFATLRAFSAEKSGSLAELQAAESKAKDARRGIWHDYDPSEAEPNGDAVEVPATSNGDAAPSKDYRDILITHVEPTCRLKFQQVSTSTTGALTSLMSSFRSIHASSPPQSYTNDAPPKAGEYISARFSADGEWYRARVRRNDRDAKSAEVVYIDYGNGENLLWTKLKHLPQPDRFGVAALKAQRSRPL